jgi:hypothetical protein
MMKLNHRYHSIDLEFGQGLSEYALLLAFIAVVGIGILTVMGNQVSGAYGLVQCGIQGYPPCEDLTLTAPANNPTATATITSTPTPTNTPTATPTNTATVPILYVCGLTASSRTDGSNKWRATWIVTVCTNGGAHVRGVEVRGSLTGTGGNPSCEDTDSNGQSECTRENINNSASSVTFTINSQTSGGQRGLKREGYTYTPENNAPSSAVATRP